MLGSGHVQPATKEELASANTRFGSPDKHSRVEKYMQSTGMKDSIAYENSDFGGLVNAKPNNTCLFAKGSLKKETWRPKTSLKWTQDPRQKLTLQ